MNEAALAIALGFVLGMRHATDPDHVVAVTTIVSRQRGLRPALLTGMWWGIGHSLTVTVVGAAIILFNVTIPPRVGLGMELSVGAMLVVLGFANMATFRPSTWRALALDARFRATRLYASLRPLVIGVVHGLAGSAAVALLVVAAVRDPRWAFVYLLVFGIGTIAGMTLVTFGIASALRVAAGRSSAVARRLGFATGALSVAFGVFFAWQVWTGG